MKIKVRITSLTRQNLLEATRKSFYSPSININWEDGSVHNSKGQMESYGVREFKGRFQLFEKL